MGIDMRFHAGHIDATELPSAYKSADTIRRSMRAFGLATVNGHIEPYGCIMAGDWERDAPSRRKSEIEHAEDS